jgi:hypothetical protein
MTEHEEWRPIPGYPAYEISSLGRVTRNRAVLKQSLSSRGYRTVGLHRDGSAKTHRVHRLVLLAFVGPCPPKHEGAHLDGDKDNNTLANLSWVTAAENARHRVKHGTQARAEKHGSAKLTWRQVLEIRQRFKPGEKINERKKLAREYGVCGDAIREIVAGITWRV